MKKAAYFERLENNKVICALCPRRCEIAPGSTGICGVRHNGGGGLIAESYGAVTSMALDPIEKKPLRRFFPGRKILSVGSYGCNLYCGFCQNSSISRKKAPYRRFSPAELVDESVKHIESGNIGVAYTYNEPLIGYEFVLDCAKLVKERGLKNILVTNGYIMPEPLGELLPFIDAMNIDLKSYDPLFYRDIGGELSAVQKTIERAAKGCHVEVTALIIPGKNDSEENMRELSGWLSEVSRDIPLHVSRFFPAHKWRDISPTPVETVFRLADIARDNLRFVYTGNC